MSANGHLRKLMGVALLAALCGAPASADRDYLATRDAGSYLEPDGRRSEGSEFRLLAWTLPAEAAPGETLTSQIVWETDRGNPNAVVFATVLGDWAPHSPLALLVDGGMQGRPGNRFERSFTFQAPSRPGTYRLRWILTQAFRPVTEFYGKPDGGASDPGGGSWAEARLVVRGDTLSADPRRGRACEWYLERIRETVSEGAQREHLMRAMRSVVEIRERVTAAQGDLTYAALKSAGSLLIRTPSGSGSLEELARERILQAAPGLAGSDLVEDPAMVVAALLISDRRYFVHQLRIVPLEGEYVSVSTALERRSGLDPAVTRELLAMAEAADALSRGEDVLGNVLTLRRGIEWLGRLSDDGLPSRPREPRSRPRSEARDLRDRDLEEQERRDRREEASRRADQERQEREAAERRCAEEREARAAREQALAERAGRHPLGVALETMTSDTRERLGLFLGTYGVVVLYVPPDSLSHKAGLRAGMVIESIGHRVVTSQEELDAYISKKRSGDELLIGVWQLVDGRWKRANKFVPLRK